jgi:DNA mismatch endonuclease (patch repair protein)
MDKFTAEKRSSIMSSVRSKNTKPEVYVRSMLHNNGLRFRLHRQDLPGSPDIVLARFKTVIFVNGCFWHGHDCPKGRRPVTNLGYWNEKLDQNLRRDRENHSDLRDMGWRVIIIWECELVNATEKIIGELKIAKPPRRRKQSPRDNVRKS